jgi:hypothetical protein
LVPTPLAARALRDVGVWRRSPRGHDLTQRQPGDMNSSSLTIKQAPNNIVCVYSCGLRRINLVGDGRACAPLTLRAPISLSAKASPSSNEFRRARKRLAREAALCFDIRGRWRKTNAAVGGVFAREAIVFDVGGFSRIATGAVCVFIWKALCYQSRAH